MVETQELREETRGRVVQVAVVQEALTETLVLAEMLTPAVVAVVQVAILTATVQVVRA
jgi:flagellar biosynthesis protein FliQ